jgi:hypothetical protein
MENSSIMCGTDTSCIGNWTRNQLWSPNPMSLRCEERKCYLIYKCLEPTTLMDLWSINWECMLVSSSLNHEALQIIIPPFLVMYIGVMTVECSADVVLFFSLSGDPLWVWQAACAGSFCAM